MSWFTASAACQRAQCDALTSPRLVEEDAVLRGKSELAVRCAAAVQRIEELSNLLLSLEAGFNIRTLELQLVPKVEQVTHFNELLERNEGLSRLNVGCADAEDALDQLGIPAGDLPDDHATPVVSTKNDLAIIANVLSSQLVDVR
ncbi:hypothetical protein HG530_003354 [Fusarium avenaceum]|nr:hypothetical protein HG530_003354 [Fusarium avenaceum]